MDTPVWAAEHEGTFYIFSAGNAGKVKRLNNSPRAKLATCTSKGKLTGSWHDAQALIVTDLKEIEVAYRALRQKYGWRIRLLDFGAKLTGHYYRRAIIAATLKDEQ